MIVLLACLAVGMVAADGSSQYNTFHYANHPYIKYMGHHPNYVATTTPKPYMPMMHDDDMMMEKDMPMMHDDHMMMKEHAAMHAPAHQHHAAMEHPMPYHTHYAPYTPPYAPSRVAHPVT